MSTDRWVPFTGDMRGYDRGVEDLLHWVDPLQHILADLCQHAYLSVGVYRSILRPFCSWKVIPHYPHRCLEDIAPYFDGHGLACPTLERGFPQERALLGTLTIGDTGWTRMIDGLGRDFPLAFDGRGLSRGHWSLPRLRGLFGVALEQVR